jgi:hypothetical protein
MIWAAGFSWPYDDVDTKKDKEAEELKKHACSHKWVNVSFNHIKIECYYCGQAGSEKQLESQK